MIGWSAGGKYSANCHHGTAWRSLPRLTGVMPVGVAGAIAGGRRVGKHLPTEPLLRPRTGTVDFSRLRYSAEMPSGLDCLRASRGSRAFRVAASIWMAMITALQQVRRLRLLGGLRPAAAGPPAQGVLHAGSSARGQGPKVFGRDWPAHIATSTKSMSTRLAEYPLPVRERRCAPFPGDAGRGVESGVGHATAAADHPHAIARSTPGSTLTCVGCGSTPTRITSPRQCDDRRPAAWQNGAGIHWTGRRSSRVLAEEKMAGQQTRRDGSHRAELADRTE